MQQRACEKSSQLRVSSLKSLPSSEDVNLGAATWPWVVWSFASIALASDSIVFMLYLPSPPHASVVQFPHTSRHRRFH